MAKALPIKTKRRANAAYAASQPLFDVLSKGMQHLDVQRANLEIARNAVQKLHVKLPSSSIADDVQDDHDTYMNGVVKAWRLATESYREIFDALADVTAADPSAGKNEREGHEAFTKMAGTARNAYDKAMDWHLTTPRSSIGPNTHTAHALDGDADMQDSNGNEESDATSLEQANGTSAADAKPGDPAKRQMDAIYTRPTNPVLMSLLAKGIKVEIPEPEPEPNHVQNGAEQETVPDAAAQAHHHDAGRAQKRLEKRRKRREKREQSRANDAKVGVGQSNGTTAEGGHIAPHATTEGKRTKPEYEDVSAEVAARLKAKDAKPEAKEKKRKRESATSLDNGQLESKAEKPKKKKAKSNVGETVDDAAKREKVGKHEMENEAMENGVVEEGRKKRKKV